MKAWYFAPKNNRLRYGDDRLIRVGITHRVGVEPETCERGLHASLRVIDALQYAETSILYRVELGGKMDHADDKIAAQSRKYLKRMDIEKILFEFSRKAAKRNIEKIKPYTTDDDYSLIIKWLDTGDQSLKGAAWSAARSAARSAAWSAARSAAGSAERDWQESTLLEMINAEFDV